MSDLNDSIHNLEKASNGNDVKDGIIEVLETLNNGNAADTLDGHDYTYFVMDDDMRDQVGTINNNIDKINGKKVEGGALTKLSKTLDTKEKLKQAISERNVSISDSDTLYSYGEKISQINDSNTVNITIEDNGTITALDQGVAGFSSVTVDLSSKMQDLDVVTNGTYNAEIEGFIGFKNVNVNIGSYSGADGPFIVRFMDTDGVTVLRVVTNVSKGGSAIYTGPTPTSEGYKFVGWRPSNFGIKEDTLCYPIFEKADSDASITLNSDWSDVLENPSSIPIGTTKLLKLNKTDSTTGSDYRFYRGSATDDVSGYSGSYCIMEKVYSGEQGTGSTWLCKDIPIYCYLSPKDNYSYYGNRSYYLYHPWSYYTEFAVKREGINPITEIYQWGWCDLDKSQYPTYYKGGMSIRSWLNNSFLNNIIPSDVRSGIKKVKKYSNYARLDIHPLTMDGNGVVHDTNTYKYTVVECTTEDKIWVPSVGELYNRTVDGELTPAGDQITVYSGEVQYLYRSSTAENRKLYYHKNYDSMDQFYGETGVQHLEKRNLITRTIGSTVGGTVASFNPGNGPSLFAINSGDGTITARNTFHGGTMIFGFCI